MTPTTTALAPHLTIGQLVKAYHDAVARIRVAFGELNQAVTGINLAFGSGEEDHTGISLRGRSRSYSLGDFELDDVIDNLRKEVWYYIVSKLEIRRFLSIKRCEELDDNLDKGRMPEITEENIASLMASFVSQVDAMVQEAVVEIYDWLRPHEDSYRAKYKSNNQYVLGKKVVLTGAIEIWGFNGCPYHVHHWTSPRLRALENVFSGLDGKGTVTKTHNGVLIDAIQAATDGHGATEYFEFRCFKNRNLHITFLREDLVAKFNAIASGKTLKPGKGVAA